MTPIIGFVGYSNSGKTLVVASMIKILSSRGYRVASLKHASHGYDMDVPGKDSWQHYESGAEKVVVVGPSSFMVHQRCSAPPALNDILSMVNDVDIILLEGFKSEPVPKVVIIREEVQTEVIKIDSEALAVVSDMALKLDIPIFSFEQLDLLADYLLDVVPSINN
ncbi:MAG: molybdopterin-guanine dinucleotide biosynthesis protein B [Syntrophomonas sp.]